MHDISYGPYYLNEKQRRLLIDLISLAIEALAIEAIEGNDNIPQDTVPDLVDLLDKLN